MSRVAAQSPLVAILLPDLRGGGAERMHLDLAREWFARGLAVEFVLLRGQGELLPLLPQGASVVDLKVDRLRKIFRPLARYLRSRRPQVLLAPLWPLSVMAALLCKVTTGGRVIVSEHNTLSRQYADRPRLHRCLMRCSMALGYRLSDVVIAVSNGVADDLVRLSGIDRLAFKVIHNPAARGAEDETPAAGEREDSGNERIILSVGSLKAQKNHALLIRSFCRLPSSHGARLWILGAGDLRPALERLCDELGISDRVSFLGFRKETRPYYRKAALFVLSSDYEGFGNVIVEALECGVPVVSTDCPSGPAEILADGRFGRLVPVGDERALAEAMEMALAEVPDREALMRRAQDFSVQKISMQYLAVMLPELCQIP